MFYYVQVSALSKFEAKKRFEFLEAVSGMMDAQLRFFKQVWNMSYDDNSSFCYMYLFSMSNFWTLVLCRDMNSYIRWNPSLTRFVIVTFSRIRWNSNFFLVRDEMKDKLQFLSYKSVKISFLQLIFKKWKEIERSC